MPNPTTAYDTTTSCFRKSYKRPLGSRKNVIPFEKFLKNLTEVVVNPVTGYAVCPVTFDEKGAPTERANRRRRAMALGVTNL
jgi:hypothetical protein